MSFPNLAFRYSYRPAIPFPRRSELGNDQEVAEQFAGFIKLPDEQLDFHPRFLWSQLFPMGRVKVIELRLKHGFFTKLNRTEVKAMNDEIAALKYRTRRKASSRALWP